jgi:signal peptidase I
MSQNITEEKEIIKDVSEEAKSIPIENILEQPLEQETNKEEKEDVLEEEQEELVVPEEEIKEKTKDIILKLGDIIIITNPTNEILNNNVFFIDYIDPNKIRLINSENFEKTTLQITPDGVIGDGSITSIKVISSNEKLGYARQNELLPGTWINIYFGGDIPAVITGQITNLEEDMIEIKTTDDDTLYINFNYQGIPEDLPIETFEIRPAPQAKEEIAEKEITADELVNLGEEELEENEASMPPITIPTNVIKEKIKLYAILRSHGCRSCSSSMKHD